jgi:hypothetical protein
MNIIAQFIAGSNNKGEAEDKSASLFRGRNFHASRIPLNKGSGL